MTDRELRDLRLGVELRIADLRAAGEPVTLSVSNGIADVSGHKAPYDAAERGSRSLAIKEGLDEIYVRRSFAALGGPGDA